MSQTPAPTKLFCTSQVLSLLHPPAGKDIKPYLSGDRFWDERHEGRGGQTPEGGNPWRPIPRPDLLTRLSSTGDIKRLAVVCAGGLGKSANLEYLAAMLTREKLVPFHFELDKKLDGLALPDNGAEFWEKTLPESFSQGKNHELKNDPSKVRLILERCRTAGRLALLFDGLDQATPAALKLVEQVLSDTAWSGCLVIVSGRPHAVYERWERLIKPTPAAWHFARVEPLAEPERHLLLGPDVLTADGKPNLDDRRERGKAVYERLPAGGRELLANPRNIEFTRRMAGYGEPLLGGRYRLEEMRTASDLFAGSVDFTVRLGFKATGAERLGEKRNQAVVSEPEDFALDLLAAFAYVMYARLYEPPEARGEVRFRPNVAVIPHEDIGKVRVAVTALLQAAGVVNDQFDVNHLGTVDLPALNALNAGVQYDLLDRDQNAKTDFRWHDRTLQEFLAAWWLSRYATGEDVERLRGWRYDNRMAEAKSLYSPLWGFLVEMPKAVRTAKWFEAVGVLFEHRVTRCCEMIYRCCMTIDGMSGSEGERGDGIVRCWQQEFVVLRERRAGGVGLLMNAWLWVLRRLGLRGRLPDRGAVARGVWSDIVRLARKGSRLPGDTGRFMMGSPEDEAERITDEHYREETVEPFGNGVGPVTNEQYELFDPGHKSEREWKEQRDIARHPVVTVDWWEAWCFCRWVGGRLPTEVEWEYACRGGTTTPYYWGPYYWGETLNDDPEDSCLWPKLMTFAVGSYAEANPHPWGLVDVHGNVWEWCDSWSHSNQMSRVLRGGSWNTIAGFCRAASRIGNVPACRDNDYGFRLVRCLD